MVEVAVIADDLSGAVEAAAAFLLRTTRIDVSLTMRPGSQFAQLERVIAVDTDSRHASVAQAAGLVDAALVGIGDAPMVVKKIDSLLRGNLVTEIAALRLSRPQMVIATALPAADRTVRGGIPYLRDTALADTDAWHAEHRPAPGSLAEALAPLAVRVISLAQLRGGAAQLLAACLNDGVLAVCDAETDSDLDLVVAAAASAFDRPALVGSAALAAAVARTMAPDAGHGAAPAELRRAVTGWQSTAAGPTGGLLVVAGTAAPSVQEQLSVLEARRPLNISVDPAAVFDPGPERAALSARIAAAVHSADLTVVRLDPAVAVDPSRSRSLAQALAESVAEAAGSARALILTGGETARRVLECRQVFRLQPLGQVHHGAVICGAAGGQLIATRPGSFGGPESLLDIADALHTARTTDIKEPA